MERQQISPVKLGLLIVAASYLLFSAHELFTLQWVGEWNRYTGQLRFDIFVEDISATTGLIFRVAAGVIAVTAVVYYFSKKPSKSAVSKILKWILVFEGIYWLGLITTAAVTLRNVPRMFSLSPSLIGTSSVAFSVVGDVMEATVLPLLLFVLAFKIKFENPTNKVVKWSLITGTIYLIVFWLTNSGMWIVTIQAKGQSYINAYPGNMLSFLLTLFGLPMLSIFTAYLTVKFRDAHSLQEVNLRLIGVAILVLGLYFLWNYLTWVIFNYPWSEEWDAWLLGHNLDLWMLSLPLLGLPLLFKSKILEEGNNSETKAKS